MKLRNKKTGEIHDITQVVFLHDMDKKFVIYSKTEGHNYAYKNLAELNEEWEDYEEPKVFWYIYGDQVLKAKCDGVIENMNKHIGNYFETEEEAEKAIEKLKAWKRLKDKGFRFTNWEFRDVLDGNLVIEAKLNFDNSNKIQRNLEICFGGEE